MTFGSSATSLCKPCLDVGDEACSCAGCEADSHGTGGSCKNRRDHNRVGASGLCSKCFKCWKCSKCGVDAESLEGAMWNRRGIRMGLCSQCEGDGQYENSEDIMSFWQKQQPRVRASNYLELSKNVEMDTPILLERVRCHCPGCAAAKHVQGGQCPGKVAHKATVSSGFCAECAHAWRCVWCFGGVMEYHSGNIATRSENKELCRRHHALAASKDADCVRVDSSDELLDLPPVSQRCLCACRNCPVRSYGTQESHYPYKCGNVRSDEAHSRGMCDDCAEHSKCKCGAVWPRDVQYCNNCESASLEHPLGYPWPTKAVILSYRILPGKSHSTPFHRCECVSKLLFGEYTGW